MYEIEVHHTFTATHALRLPDGSYEPVHSHDWRVTVVAGADELDAMDCVMDFHEFEKLLGEVCAVWADGHLNDLPPFAGGINPSAERVAEQIGVTLGAELPDRVRLARVRLEEAPGCWAIYHHG